MTTLQAIGVTLAGGSGICLISMSLFGIAVSKRSTFIAPRCAARPLNTIYNPNPTDPCQNRGNPMLGWIPWVMGLSYDTLLRGVPGTGTRNGGLSGDMLKVNLDGIVLLRFISVCLRIATVAMFFCVVCVLPLYLTARCYQLSAAEMLHRPECNGHSYNLTTYERTTLLNIPSLNFNSRTFLNRNDSALLGRLYAVVFCFWIVYFYACYQLRKEWVEILAMRRVYYLEFDHWADRKQELMATLLSAEMDDDFENEDRLNHREPWIQHPEQRDTVPNISLYSVLVGGVPAIPKDIGGDQTAYEEFLKQNIDWQLAVTASFFDHCVPNQPGFSSSVAAVTILPAASQLAKSWRKWYAAAGKLRRLRFIRKLIAERRRYKIEVGDSKERPENDVEAKYEYEELAETAPVPQRQSSIYDNSTRKRAYYKSVLGSTSDEDVETHMLHAMNYGPEQTAVYSREFARSASLCCPNGFFQERLQYLAMEDLLEMERDAIEEVHEANLELKKARAKAVEGLHRRKSMVSSKDMKRKKSYDSATATEVKLFAESAQKKNKVGSSSSRNLSRENSMASSDGCDEEAPAEMTAFSLPGSGSELRKRANTGFSEQWSLVESYARDTSNDNHGRVASGSWHLPSICTFLSRTTDKTKQIGHWAKNKTTDMVDGVARESTYAVVTFTSRQAAVAARHCLADSRGSFRWMNLKDIPVPPLADAAAGDLLTCRGCCRPVTISISENQKRIRHYLSLIMLFNLYFFYTFPLSFASQLVAIDKLDTIFPNLSKKISEQGQFLSKLLSGFLPALIWTLFFACLPFLFKAIANFGSNATSVLQAEFVSLRYFWWFMVVTAFSGSSLVQIITNGFIGGIRIGSEFQKVVTNIAATIPSQVSATWLNWIIFRFSITLPLHYVLQANAYFLHFFRMNCCARLSLGGGSGGQIPYRLYIDSGVVLLCVFALGPASPLVAAAAFIYFLFSAPILRRNLIYLYRPQFDAGGVRWPFLFDMCVSCLLVGQLLMTVMMALKSALGPAIVSFIPVVPTFLYRSAIHKRFLRAFEDASLLQTAALDGWDPAAEMSMQEREEFRKFLVDSHKAAYVPVCIAGDDTDVLTAEPAVVVPTERDELFVEDQSCMMGMEDVGVNHHVQMPMSPPGKQTGATMRRLSMPMMAGINVHANVSVHNHDFGVSQEHSPPQHGVTLRRLSMVGRPGMGMNGYAGGADCGSVVSARSRTMTDDTITNIRSLDESLGASSGKQRRAALDREDIPDDYSMYSRNAEQSTRTRQHGATFRRMSLIFNAPTGSGSIAEEAQVLNDDSINSEAYNPNFSAVLEDIRMHKLSSYPTTNRGRNFMVGSSDLKPHDASRHQTNTTSQHISSSSQSEREHNGYATPTAIPTPRQHGATFRRMSLSHPLPCIQRETVEEEGEESEHNSSGRSRRATQAPDSALNSSFAMSNISPRPLRYDSLDNSDGFMVDLGSFSPRSCRNLKLQSSAGSDLQRGAYSSPRSKSFRYVAENAKEMFDEIIPLKGGPLRVADDNSVSQSVKDEGAGDRSSRRHARTLNTYIPPPTRQHGATFRRLSVAVSPEALPEEGGGRKDDGLNNSSHHSTRSRRLQALNDSAGSFGATSPGANRSLTASPASYAGRLSLSQRTRSLRHINIESPGSSPGRGTLSSRSRSIPNFADIEASLSPPQEGTMQGSDNFEDDAPENPSLRPSQRVSDGRSTPSTRQHGATFRRSSYGRDSLAGDSIGNSSLHSSSYHSRS